MATEVRKDQLQNVSAGVYNSSDQAITTATWTKIDFGAESFDTASIHDNSTNNTRLTVPADGTYIVSYTVGFQNNATGFRATRFIVDNTTNYFGNGNAPADGNTTTLTGNMIVELSKDSYVEVQVYQSSGGNLNVLSGGVGETYFSIIKIA